MLLSLLLSSQVLVPPPTKRGFGRPTRGSCSSTTQTEEGHRTSLPKSTRPRTILSLGERPLEKDTDTASHDLTCTLTLHHTSYNSTHSKLLFIHFYQNYVSMYIAGLYETSNDYNCMPRTCLTYFCKVRPVYC